MIGNIADWNHAEWELINMQKIDVEFSEMCKSLALGPILVPEQLPATEFRHLCNQFGGKMFVIKNEEDRQKALDFRQSAHDTGKCGCKNLF